MPAINLSKGSNLNLSKTVASTGSTLRYLAAALQWDPRTTTGEAFDADAQAVLLGADGKVLNASPDNFVFYNNLSSPDGAVRLSGDNLTGVGEGDDEVIFIDLERLDPNVEKIIISISLHDPTGRISFGQIRRVAASVRATDSAGNAVGEPLVSLDASEDASTEVALLLSELYRHNGDWKVRSVLQGYADGLAGLARDFGLDA